MAGCVHILIDLVPDKMFHVIFIREALQQTFVVFPSSAADITRHADVERTVSAAGHDVNVIGF